MAETSCLDVVKGALRKLGVLASGREPRAVDRDDVFQSLKGMYRQWVNNGTLGRMQDVVPVADFTVCSAVRILRTAETASLSITLPETVSRPVFWRDYGIWGLCDCSDSRNITTPRDGMPVSISDAVIGETYDFIYDGQIKRWEGIDGLELADRAPLAWRDPQGLMAALAMQIADEFSAQPGLSTSMQAANFMSALTCRYSTPAEAQPGIFM